MIVARLLVPYRLAESNTLLAHVRRRSIIRILIMTGSRKRKENFFINRQLVVAY